MKITKRLPYILLLLVVCVLALCFVACKSSENENNKENISNIITVEQAYAAAQDLGYNGTLEEFIATISGKDGTDGQDGLSAYEIWLKNGHSGTETDFLTWLKGADGKDGSDGQNGSNGQDGINGNDGKSAYQIWIDDGHSGTETDFLTWLKGADGKDGINGENGQDGVDGKDGKDGINGNDGKDGANGLSAYEIFLKYYPYYTGTEEQWIKALVNNELIIHTITFKSEVSDDIVKYVFDGYALLDIPEVPEKEGQTSAQWDITDFTDITEDLTVNAVYDMRKYVTFHNEFTDDEDIKITVNYGEAITDIPEITAKVGNDSKWSESDFSFIKTDMQVEAIYATQGLQYTLINQQSEYKVSAGDMNVATRELFILKEYLGKPVTVIDTKAFDGYSKNYSFNSAYIPDSIVEIRSQAFYHCRLTNIKLPNSITSIGTGIFYCCRILNSIDLPNSITSISEDMFVGCESLSSIELPNNIISIEEDAFLDCKSLKNIILPEVLVKIGNYAFRGCTSLNSIIIPNSVKYLGKSAFSGCNSLHSIEVPDSIQSIGTDMFYECNALKSIILPRGLMEIMENAFYSCSKLETIYFLGSSEEFGQINISSYGNTSFTDAMKYYYSEEEPTTDGFYWHYDMDGKTPVIWVKEN